MKIARITGTVTATVKDAKLAGLTLLVADIEDGAGKVLEKSVVAGRCLLGRGRRPGACAFPARRRALPARTGGLPVDMVAAAIVDHIDIGAGSGPSTSNRRKN